MINVLITPVEVIEKGAFDRNMDPLLIEPFIQLAEYRHLASHNSFFGMELYKLLLQDGVSYANYSSTSIYAVDAVVIYGGKYYKCTVAGTTGVLPTVSANWVPVSKFANPEYQKLWDLHLWKYIAFAVQHNSTFKNSYRSTSKGVMRNEGETSKPAEFSGVKGLKDELMADIDVMREAMDDYLRTNKQHFPEYKGNCKAIAKSSGIGLYLKKTRRDSCCED